MALPVGSALPDFTLRIASQEGHKEFSMAETRGHPLVLAFFPLAFSGTCTKEVCDFRDNLAAFDGLGVKVLGFSADSHFSNVAFTKAQNLPFGILCDPNREVLPKIWELSTVAGVHNVAKRGVIVVGADGKVKWTSVGSDPTVWMGTDEVRKHLA